MPSWIYKHKPHTKETRDKISKAIISSDYRAICGWHHTDDAKQKISIWHT